ncbi:hypothetical protein AEAC466_04505 [Asticcacaulis sp. AC466]|uniref:hypothetical protein n=1 Tax=Asticcacaulis sp. AC466 TaxID=1282362 RepID=UPI0003C40622|nr:hypothetical protein [Asticcacaulis sp. AC466]ESQ85430.1 hypothetical protein AEAC466_04505 [Asticcacaulis sp. AC466]
MTDYYVLKHKTLTAVSHIGRAITAIPTQIIGRMTFAQRNRLNAKNFVADDRWQYRLIADKLVEIAYGNFMGNPVLGVTVFHLYGEDSARAEMDHNASDAVHSVDELVEKLLSLQTDGGDPTSKYHEAC